MKNSQHSIHVRRRGVFAILLYVQIFEEDRWACQMRVDFREVLAG